jgi:ABC-type transport system involved in multi-copper enzyme maturation permease subunit
MSLASSCATWLRHNLAWSNSRQSWEERLGGLALLAAAVGLVWYSASLSALAQVFLWALLLVAAAVLLRRGWLKLFGPVLFYDMVRSGRRGRYILLRCCYAGVLFVLFFGFFLESLNSRWDASPSGPALRAERCFETLMLAQLLTALLLTPVYVAGSIADEKDRRTLEFLLATDLRNREIVFSKLVARLASLALLVLTGLPILGLLQLLGGVDPNLVLAGFAATGLTMLGLAGLGILCSTYARRARDAIALTYAGLFAYYVLSYFTLALLDLRPAFLAWPIWFGDSPPTVASLLQTFNAGNLLLVIGEVVRAGYSGTLATTLPALLGGYALFHGALAGLCCTWAVLRLRAVALAQAGAPARRHRRLLRVFRRTRVSNRPMFWKEIHIEGAQRMGWLLRLLLLGLAALTFFPAALILYRYYFEFGYRSYWGMGDALVYEMNIWVRTWGTLVGCLILLGVAVRASTCVSRERDRQTLDGLLTTPLDSDDILLAKCVGNVLAVRRLWLWLGAIWALGLVTGGLSPLALPLVVAAWFIFAAALSVVGAWFSVVSRTGLRATVWTLLATLGLAVGHWLLWACMIPLALGGGGGGTGLESLAKLQAGCTPPANLALLQFSTEDLQKRFENDTFQREILVYCIVGLFLWGLLTSLLWVAVSGRFRLLTNRHRGVDLSHRRPDMPPTFHDEEQPSPAPPRGPPPRGQFLIEEGWDPSPDQAKSADEQRIRRPDP